MSLRATSKMNIDTIREDFPFLKNSIDGRPIIYLDSACQSLRPNLVIDEINDYYKNLSSCGGRSSHSLAYETTKRVEESRKAIADIFNANSEDEIVFTRNTTEGINLVANSIGLKKDDVVITTDKEHNSNLVPWLYLEQKIGIKKKMASFDDEFDLESFESLINSKVKLVSMVQTSNIDGTSIPVKEIIKIAHEKEIPVMLDGAQAAPHKRIDLKKLDVDFYAASGHKMLGPSGTGILYGKYDMLNQLANFIVGGDTVEETTYDSFIPKLPPKKFEAGLQDYAGILGLGKAAGYLRKIGPENIESHTNSLNNHITKRLKEMPKINILGPLDARKRSSIFSFNIDGFYPADISSYAEKGSNVFIRSGFHCCHSWFKANKINGSARASLGIYNTKEECDIFCEKIVELVNFVSK
jgi:cysteine desulfurase/selenocysteine lyase